MSQPDSQSTSLTVDQLDALLEPDALVDRELLDRGELRQMTLNGFEEALYEIERLVYLRALDSRFVSDLFWSEIENRISSGDRVNIAQRVRVKRGTLEIAYMKNVYQTTPGKFYADHVSRTKRYSYAKRDLSFAKPWEVDLAMGHEDHHASNRKMFKHLSEARRNLRIALREFNKAFPQKADDDWMDE